MFSSCFSFLLCVYHGSPWLPKSLFLHMGHLRRFKRHADDKHPQQNVHTNFTSYFSNFATDEGMTASFVLCYCDVLYFNQQTTSNTQKRNLQRVVYAASFLSSAFALQKLRNCLIYKGPCSRYATRPAPGMIAIMHTKLQRTTWHRKESGQFEAW